MDNLFRILAPPFRVLDWLIDKIILIILIVFFLFGAYSLYDTWVIYDKAADSTILALKPVVNEDGTTDIGQLFNELLELNKDVKGWISIEDTTIDYPILQGQTNFDYINTDVYGEYSLSGSIFLDSRNNPNLTDSYSIVYGHHMDNGGMFGSLDSFLEQSYLNEHQSAKLYTLEEIYDIQLFACIRADAYDLGYYTPIMYESTQPVLDKIKNDAVSSTENQPSENDKIIMFSTCAAESTNGRIILFGYY